MKLSNTAIKKLKGSVPSRLRLALAMGCSEQWVNRLLNKNEDSSDLTKESALRVIEEETGFSRDMILEMENQVTAQN